MQWARGELWSPAAMPLAVCVRAACVGLLGWRCIGSTHHSWAETLCMRAAGCRCVRLPESSSTLHCQPTKNPEEDNGVVEAYYQVGGSCRAAAGHLLGCAGQLMPHPAPFSKRGRTPSPLPVMPPVVPWTPPPPPPRRLAPPATCACAACWTWPTRCSLSPATTRCAPSSSWATACTAARARRTACWGSV